jgi:hypothetical protein
MAELHRFSDGTLTKLVGVQSGSLTSHTVMVMAKGCYVPVTISVPDGYCIESIFSDWEETKNCPKILLRLERVKNV